MRTIEVEFTEEEKNELMNKICDTAENEEKCREGNGHEFIVSFNDELHVHAKILIFDDYNIKRPVRHTSTDIKLITVDGFYPVKSNLDYLFEDKINKALTYDFNK